MKYILIAISGVILTVMIAYVVILIKWKKYDNEVRNKQKNY